MHQIETVDAITLPAIWPGLRRVDMWVSSRSPVLDVLFYVAARVPAVRAAVVAAQPYGVKIARLVGATSGAFGVEIEDATGTTMRHAFVARRASHITAVAPAALAARAMAEERFVQTGLVPHDRHVDAGDLLEYLRSAGINHVTW
jgi:hypothetical protein